jgi:O-antigen/teichoic acid export membrane protein
MRILISVGMPPRFFQPLVAKIKASPLGYRLARGAMWSMIGTILSRGLSVVATIAVARMLGKIGFGELGIIQSTLLNLSVFTSHGLGLTAIKYVSELREKDPIRAGRIMTLSGIVACCGGCMLALALALASPWFAERLLAAPHLAGFLQIGSLLILFSAMNGAQNGALAGLEAFRRIAQVNLIVGLLNFPIMFIGVWTAGLKGAVWGLVASSAVGWLITHRALRLEARRAGLCFTYKGHMKEIPVLSGFSFPALLSSVVYGPVGWACSVLLVNQPDGYPQMAIFNATNQWFALILFLPAQVSQVILPMLSEAVGSGDSKRTKKILKLAVRTNLAVMLPLLAMILLASPWLMSLYGPGYSEHWPTFVVAMLTAGILAIMSPWAEVLNAGNVQWTMFGLNVAWGIASLSLAPFLLGWGALGLVTLRLIAFSVKAGLTVLCGELSVSRLTRVTTQ